MRSWSLGSPRGMRLVAVVIAVLLVVLAILQYRWIGEVSRAERQRLRAGLSAAADRFAADLGHDLTRAMFVFQPGLSRATAQEATAVERWRYWRENASQPELVRAVYLVEWGDDGRPAVSRIDPETDTAGPVGWPVELASVRTAVERMEAVRAVSLPFPFDPQALAIVLPLHRLPFSTDGDRKSQGMLIAMLDRRFLTEEVFPELAERCFGVSRAPEYLVAVQGPAGLVYRSDSALPKERYLPGDISVPLFGMHRGEGHRFHGEHGERDREPWPPRREAPPPPRRAEAADGPPDWDPPPRGLPMDRRAGLFVDPPPNPWRLVVSHREGSLEAAVEVGRRRNLAVSLGVLALLAATLGVLGASTQRAGRLARQQLEFVAGVTHELNTPLAAIRAAGQNLADGVVAKPEQVKGYGALIEREGRRLTGMVGKALDLAGIQSGSKTYRPEPVAVSAVVDEALDDYRWMLEEKEVAVEKNVPADLPEVMMDRAALRMVVQNLLDNAVKYAGRARWIGIRGGAGRDGREVSLTVEDRGPGIHIEDRKHLFEPFYRGRDVTESAIHGAGLGLSLVRHAVEAHHGTLSVATGPGGSAFTVRLPVAAAPAVPAREG